MSNDSFDLKALKTVFKYKIPHFAQRTKTFFRPTFEMALSTKWFKMKGLGYEKL
jgi:hypothetical protein